MVAILVYHQQPAIFVCYDSPMTWQLRLRAILDSWFEVVAILLAVGVLLGAWGIYATHVDPGTTTEERVESSWAIQGSYEHEATVTQPNAVYDVGTTLEDRSIYPAEVAPALDGTFVFAYGASEGGDLDVDVDLTLHHQAVEEFDDGDAGQREEVVWEHEEPLGDTSASSLDPDTTLDEEFTVDLPLLANQTEQIEESVGQVPGDVETFVSADVHLSGTVNGDPVEMNRTYALPLSADGDAYRIEGNPTDLEEFESTVQVPVERTYSPVRTVGAPLLAAVSLVLLGGLVAAKRRGGLALDDDERARLAYHDDREEFDEWITTMSLPDDVEDPPRAEAASLADLVDFAIDTDSGVVYDPDRDVYVTTHRGVTYVFYPPTGAVGSEPPPRLPDPGDDSATEPDDDTEVGSEVAAGDRVETGDGAETGDGMGVEDGPEAEAEPEDEAEVGADGGVGTDNRQDGEQA